MTEIGDSGGGTDKVKILEHLEQHIRFQRRWRNCSMSLYVVITAAVTLCSTGATIISAYNRDAAAAVLAGAATVLVGLDRSLLFREKWKLHVAILTKLDIIKLGLSSDLVDTKTAVTEIIAALGKYADSLPFAESRLI
jgi:hypothetical protein